MQPALDDIASPPFSGADAGTDVRGFQQIAEDRARFGQAFEAAGPAVSRFDGQRALTEATNANAYIFARLLQARTRYQNDPDYSTPAQRWAGESDQIVETGLAGISNDRLRDHVRRSLNEPLAQQDAAIPQQAFRGAADAHAVERGNYLDNLIQHITLDPTDALITGGIDAYHSAVDDAAARGFLTPDLALTEKRSAALRLCTAEYSLMARCDPERATRELNSGNSPNPIAQFLPAEVKDTLIDQAQLRQQAIQVDGQRTRLKDERDTQRASDEAEARYATDLLSDNPTATATDIYADNMLTLEAKRRLLVTAKTAMEPEPSAEISNATALGLIDRIRRPDGDPEHITSLAPILEAFNASDLTRTDFKLVTKQLTDARAPDGDILTRHKQALIDLLKPFMGVSASGDPGHDNNDPAAAAQLYNIEREIDWKIERYRTEGKDPNDLFDPSKPDYLGGADFLSHFVLVTAPRHTINEILTDSTNTPSSPATSGQPARDATASAASNVRAAFDNSTPAVTSDDDDGPPITIADTNADAAEEARNVAAERLRQTLYHRNFSPAEQSASTVTGRKIGVTEAAARGLADELSFGTAPAIAARALPGSVRCRRRSRKPYRPMAINRCLAH